MINSTFYVCLIEIRFKIQIFENFNNYFVFEKIICHSLLYNAPLGTLSKREGHCKAEVVKKNCCFYKNCRMLLQCQLHIFSWSFRFTSFYDCKSVNRNCFELKYFYAYILHKYVYCIERNPQTLLRNSNGVTTLKGRRASR